MKYHLNKILFLFGILIPSFLLSTCSDKTEIVHISAKSKVWLGIYAKNIPERRLENLKLDYGLEVIKVYKDSPAEKAGIKVDDILLKINGSPLKEVEKLSDVIRDMKIDEEIKITYMRNGKEIETEATLTKNDRKIYVFNDRHQPFEHFISNEKHAWLGVSTTKLTDQLRQFFNVPEYLGVLVNEVVEDSPAQKYGLKAGDIIIKIGRKEIEDHQDLIRAIDRYDPGEEVEVKIIRDKKEKTTMVTLGEGKGRFSRHFSNYPDKFEVYVPEMEFEFPEMNIRVPEIDLESLEEFEEIEEKVREEIEQHSDELDEELEKLEKELKEIKIHSRHRKSAVI